MRGAQLRCVRPTTPRLETGLQAQFGSHLTCTLARDEKVSKPYTPIIASSNPSTPEIVKRSALTRAGIQGEAQVLVHRADVGDRKVGVELLHKRSQPFARSREESPDVWQDERHRRVEALQGGRIEVPLRRFAKTLVLPISHHSDNFDPRCRRSVAQGRKRLPIGPSPRPILRASVSFTIPTGCMPTLSCSVKSPPGTATLSSHK